MPDDSTRLVDDYDAVVFDNDGVIVEPTDRDILVDAVVETFAAFDVAVDRSFAHETVARGMGPHDILGDEFDVDPAAFWERREALASQAQQAAIRNGGKPLYDDVGVLTDIDAPLGLVSNNQDETVSFILDHYDLGDHFETALGRVPTLDGMARRKPDPHYIERALAELGVEDALYVGDSETDVIAAQRAGIDAAYLRRDHVADVDLSVEPRYDVPDLRALLDRDHVPRVD
jgi:HAD superfamily hydrolase (TIGR01549 family)